MEKHENIKTDKYAFSWILFDASGFPLKFGEVK